MKRRMNNKPLALVICFLMVFSAFMPVFGASDYDSHWAKDVITAAVSAGTVTGYPDGSFRPDATISRVEFFQMINKTFKFTKEVNVLYADVSKNSWEYGVVAKANTAGYISGYADGTMHPQDRITRQEAAIVISRLKTLPAASNVLAFADAASIADWSKLAIIGAFEAKVMAGYPDGTFKPEAPITRAEALVILNKTYAYQPTTITPDLVYDKAGVYGSTSEAATIRGNVVIQVSGVTLQNATVQGNVTIDKSVGEGNVTLKDVKIAGTIYVNGGGMSSVHFENVMAGTVVVLKDAGPVRIVASGTSVISLVTAVSDIKLEESNLTGAGFESVTVQKNAANGSDITLVNVQCERVNIEAIGVTLTVEKTATVETLTIDAEGTRILGDGAIDTAMVNANDVSFKTEPDTVTVASGITDPVIMPNSDTDATLSSQELEDLEDGLNADYGDYQDLDFEYSLSGDEEKITVKVDIDEDDWDDLSTTEQENLLQDIADDLWDDAEDAEIAFSIKNGSTTIDSVTVDAGEDVNL